MSDKKEKMSEQREADGDVYSVQQYEAPANKRSPNSEYFLRLFCFENHEYRCVRRLAQKSIN